jgi:hypothetical protein
MSMSFEQFVSSQTSGMSTTVFQAASDAEAAYVVVIDLEMHTFVASPLTDEFIEQVGSTWTLAEVRCLADRQSYIVLRIFPSMKFDRKQREAAQESNFSLMFQSGRGLAIASTMGHKLTRWSIGKHRSQRVLRTIKMPTIVREALAALPLSRTLSLSRPVRSVLEVHRVCEGPSPSSWEAWLLTSSPASSVGEGDLIVYPVCLDLLGGLVRLGFRHLVVRLLSRA